MKAEPRTHPPIPRVARTRAELHARVSDWHKAGRTVALVPTMGALHAGHLSLVEMAARRADEVIVSIFVNPTQFAPHEDFNAYPRAERSDLEKLAGGPATLVYGPAVEEMYPPGDATTVAVAGPALGLESETRPHFFGGVATVVSRLLMHCTPDIAVFGEKDYQQLLVIRRMTADLGIATQILAGPCVREEDGLALSSRNQYLSPAERTIAPAMHRALEQVAQRLDDGWTSERAVAAAAREILEAGYSAVDYVAVRDAATLGAWTAGQPGRVLAAARLGKTRLIDNIAVA